MTDSQNKLKLSKEYETYDQQLDFFTDQKLRDQDGELLNENNTPGDDSIYQAFNLVNPPMENDGQTVEEAAQQFLFETYEAGGESKQREGRVEVFWNPNDIKFSRQEYEMNNYKIASLRNGKNSSIQYSIESNNPNVAIVQSGQTSLNSQQTAEIKIKIQNTTRY